MILLFDNQSQKENDTFLVESLGCGVIDCGCTDTASGELWFETHLDRLDDVQKSKVQIYSSDKNFKFGDGNVIQSLKRAVVPICLGKKEVFLSIEILPVNIPLLLSIRSLTKGNSTIDFANNMINILGEKIPLKETSSGHLLLPLGSPKLENSNESTVLLNSTIASGNKDADQKLVWKLHRQFCHPPARRLKKLITDSGTEDKSILKLVDDVEASCDTCKRLYPTPNKPAVGFPLASTFNETVALDLKQFKPGIYMLHFIDHATRYSSGCIIRDKNPKTIVNGILLYWVKWFGTPQKFFWDNGGEFVNSDVIDLAEKCNIVIKTTAAESPWSNGLCERHNGLIGRNIHKVRLDTGCSLEIALAWSVSAKNCLANVYGFSPNQLVFGKTLAFQTFWKISSLQTTLIASVRFLNSISILFTLHVKNLLEQSPVKS